MIQSGQLAWAIADVQIKYGSKVPNCNVIHALFTVGEQSLITGAKLERRLLWRDFERHGNALERLNFGGVVSAWDERGADWIQLN